MKNNRYYGGGKSLGCLPGAAFAFGLGVILALSCSYNVILVILSVFLIGMVIYCWCSR